MDMAARCKEKMAYFRMQELKRILGQLGLSKEGRKQILVDRLLKTISDVEDPKMQPNNHAIRKEVVEKLINDTFRGMQFFGGAGTLLASRGQGASENFNVKGKGGIEDWFEVDTESQCLSGNALDPGSNIEERCIQLRREISQTRPVPNEYNLFVGPSGGSNKKRRTLGHGLADHEYSDESSNSNTSQLARGDSSAPAPVCATSIPDNLPLQEKITALKAVFEATTEEVRLMKQEFARYRAEQEARQRVVEQKQQYEVELRKLIADIKMLMQKASELQLEMVAIRAALSKSDPSGTHAAFFARHSLSFAKPMQPSQQSPQFSPGSR